MKTVSSITTVLKLVIKYGALLAVLVKVIQFAVDEVEALGLDKETKKDE
jgi:hypothetical protein